MKTYTLLFLITLNFLLGSAAKAVVATARKLAIIYYKMVSNKEAFNPQALADYQQRYKDKKISQLKKKIAKLEAA